jgi:hypothetical protein
MFLIEIVVRKMPASVIYGIVSHPRVDNGAVAVSKMLWSNTCAMTEVSVTLASNPFCYSFVVSLPHHLLKQLTCAEFFQHNTPTQAPTNNPTNNPTPNPTSN